jgi:hypothetical protein
MKAPTWWTVILVFNSTRVTQFPQLLTFLKFTPLHQVFACDFCATFLSPCKFLSSVVLNFYIETNITIHGHPPVWPPFHYRVV